MNIYLLFILASTVESHTALFYLLTPENQNHHVRISPESTDKHVNNDYEILILIHGWNTTPNQTWYQNLTNALFSRGKYNIIQVDWSDLSTKNYIVAVKDSPEIGQKIGDLILNLTRKGTPLKNIQIIGHSLGAQISGFVGDYVHGIIGEKLPRITGLDPAGPLFTKPHIASYKLDKNDADIVYCIHSDRTVLGVFGDCGTTDVYPNGGGGPQKGCPLGLHTASCRHARSHQLFISAIANPGTLLAAKCFSYVNLLTGRCNHTKRLDLGGEITLKDNGRYYLTTTSHEPFISLIPSG